jgi:hypothetical protein
MKVAHFEQTPAKPVEMEGSSGCRVRWLVDEKDGAPTFAMRQFEVAPGGHTPQHFHDYEHEVFVLEAAASCSKPAASIRCELATWYSSNRTKFINSATPAPARSSFSA